MACLRWSFIIAGALLIISLLSLAASLGVYWLVGREPKPPKISPLAVKDSPSLASALARFYDASGLLPSSLKISPTRFKLVGTYLGREKIALIKAGKKIIFAREGAKLGSWKVQAVEKEAVILASGGKIIRLRLFKSRDIHSAGFKSPQERIVISRSQIKRLTADPGVMFSQIRLVPYMVDGRTEGFRFEYLNPESLFYQAGIRPGDILVAVNNIPIRSSEDAFRILEELRNESLITVTLKRHGSPVNIEVEIR